MKMSGWSKNTTAQKILQIEKKCSFIYWSGSLKSYLFLGSRLFAPFGGIGPLYGAEPFPPVDWGLFGHPDPPLLSIGRAPFPGGRGPGIIIGVPLAAIGAPAGGGPPGIGAIWGELSTFGSDIFGASENTRQNSPIFWISPPFPTMDNWTFYAPFDQPPSAKENFQFYLCTVSNNSSI
jgi:hypothetical protein